MAGIRNVFLGTLTALVLIMLFSCSMQPGDLSENVITLKIGVPSSARLIEVTEYDVESLDIEIRGPGDVLLAEIHWEAPDSETHMIPAAGTGTYRIIVTHNGVNGDSTRSVTEEAEFEIAAMKITVITVIPGMLGVLDIDGEVPDPVDLTGYWVATWDIDGYIVTPMYTYLRQTGTIVDMAYGISGWIEGDTWYIDGEIPDVGLITGSSTIHGDPLVGTMTMTDYDGNIMMVADTSMTRADQADFGHLDLVGNLEGTILDLNTDWAMAGFGVDDEGWGPYEFLDIRFFDADYDVYINFSIEQAAGGFGTGTFPITNDFTEPMKVEMWARYMVDGVGFVDQPIMSNGLLIIDYWDGTRAAGSFTVNAPHEMTAHFDLPFTEEADFF